MPYLDKRILSNADPNICTPPERGIFIVLHVIPLKKSLLLQFLRKRYVQLYLCMFYMSNGRHNNIVF